MCRRSSTKSYFLPQPKSTRSHPPLPLKVLLAEYEGAHYALKCMKKAFVEEQGLVEHVKRERVRRGGEGLCVCGGGSE